MLHFRWACESRLCSAVISILMVLGNGSAEGRMLVLLLLPLSTRVESRLLHAALRKRARSLSNHQRPGLFSSPPSPTPSVKCFLGAVEICRIMNWTGLESSKQQQHRGVKKGGNRLLHSHLRRTSDPGTWTQAVEKHSCYWCIYFTSEKILRAIQTQFMCMKEAEFTLGMTRTHALELSTVIRLAYFNTS